MAEHYCTNCGGHWPWGLKHVCKPISEARLREIIREELARGVSEGSNP